MRHRRFARRNDSSAVPEILRWVAALALMFLILAGPDRVTDIYPAYFLRLPLELPVAVFLLAVLSGPPRRLVRIGVVVLLALLLVFKLADMAAYFGFDRPFNPLVDIFMVPVALDTLSKAGGVGAVAGAAAAIVLVIGLIIALLVWATGVVVRDSERGGRGAIAVLALIAGGLVFTPWFKPYGTFGASLFVRDEARFVTQSLKDAAQFRVQLAQDPFSDLPASNLLAKLKGKDVLLIFVESYGRSSLDHPDYTALIRGTLKNFDAALTEKGFAARSAWVKSATFGGESYLAHSTTVSGLWIENQQRYAQLLKSQHRTLIRDFDDAGWRTVTVMPEITMPWPEADFFHFSKVYTAPDLGYKGQSFDYITMPDQFTLAAFQARELAKADRPPVMAEIALVSSHIPWVPIPKLVPWEQVGDGTIFNTARTTEDGDVIWKDPKRVAQYYAMSIDYSLQTLQSFITTYGDDNTVFIILGDHQPMTFIAGEGASHEVPIHIIAKDSAVLAGIDGGQWTAGMEPNASSPSWPMDTLRAHILRGFTPKSGEEPPAAEVQPPPPATEMQPAPAP